MRFLPMRFPPMRYLATDSRRRLTFRHRCTYGLACAAALLLLSACEGPFEVEPDYEPLLQLDATITAGSPIPEIRIRRTFRVTGSDEVIVPEDELWAAGASVVLRRDGERIALEEVAPGRFVPAAGTPPAQRGDHFAIDVTWESLVARAEASVPDTANGDFSLEVGTPAEFPDLVLRNTSTGSHDTLRVYGVHARLAYPTPPPVVLLQLATVSELELSGTYGETNGLTPSLSPEAYVSFFEDEVGVGRIAYDTSVYDYSLRQESGTEGSGTGEPDTMEVRAVLVVPEAIYGDYVRTGSDALTPVTVTNVEGGVGLFIGATRDTLAVRLPLPQ